MTGIQHLLRSYAGDYVIGETRLSGLSGRTLAGNDCTLLLCSEGRAVVNANERKRTFRNGDLAVLFSDTAFTPLDVSPSFRATYLCLSEKLMEEVYYSVNSASFWEQAYLCPVLRLSDGQNRLVRAWFEQMRWVIVHGEAASRVNILRGSILNLFWAIDGEFRRRGATADYFSKDRAWTLFGRFAALLDKYCHERREAQFYADKLCITTSYLYKICHKIQHQTPKEIINAQTVNELKGYLTGTDLSIKDLAREFHFEDPSYLCRFFRRMTGRSPMEYRDTANPLR